ncbi:hypothetical protein GM415_05355 [Pseudodesulfovibrio cashew]|uniref:CPXCG motif-containing cysteine-rich protein n=1 Tax=Pseudodesulfovibrio cashew TaxID=2678688 RepID=A0A6I6JHJ6_9BACT|nr:hypothetical protein [Pseudodesulfovibrio cashew]QGY39567.1 hypothetical protein GM415_05355 [Pseudodesulfovibrio cashew]
MSVITVNCPYCAAVRSLPAPQDYSPFYVDCDRCSERFIVEPVQNGTMVYRDGEAPCCSDPECRATEMGDAGQD